MFSNYMPEGPFLSLPWLWWHTLWECRPRRSPSLPPPTHPGLTVAAGFVPGTPPPLPRGRWGDAAHMHGRGDRPPRKLRVFSPRSGDAQGECCAGFSDSSILPVGTYPRHRCEHFGGGPSLASTSLLWPLGPRSRVPEFAAEPLPSASSVPGSWAGSVRVPNSCSSAVPLRMMLWIRPQASC